MGRSCEVDEGRIGRMLREQYDVITIAQALRCGLTRKAVAHRLRPEGPWQRLLPGICLAVSGQVSQQHREMAALLYAGPRSMLTGPVAVRRHGLTSPGPNTVDVLVPLTVRRQGTGFVRLHRTARLPGEVASTGSIRFAPAARAVADAARSFTRLSEVRDVVCDAIQRRACTVPDLVTELEAGPTQGSALFRAALEEVGDQVRSVAEADFRVLVLRSGLPRPVFNALLFDARGRNIATVDAWWQRAGVAVEIDSRNYHFTARQQDYTSERHDELTAHGILVLHFAPKVIRTDGPGVLAKIGRAIEQGLARPPIPVTAAPLAS